jgi:hypothetical protein
MLNWLGQEIEIDDYVFKGAREGNGSMQRVGKVLEFRELKVPSSVSYGGPEEIVYEARVEWKFRYGAIWRRGPHITADDFEKVPLRTTDYLVRGAVAARETRPGWNNIHTLVKVDISNLEELTNE